MQSSIVIDQFAYVRAYAPRFPEEDRADTSAELGRLLQMMEKYADRLRSEAAKKWFAISVREVEQAGEAYGSGDENRGEALLSSAVEHFKASVTGKPIRQSFAATSDGAVEKI